MSQTTRKHETRSAQRELSTYHTGTTAEIRHSDCQRCGHHVVERYRELFGDENDHVHLCPSCPDLDLAEIDVFELAAHVSSPSDAREFLNAHGLNDNDEDDI